jgi:hypothetical protein
MFNVCFNLEPIWFVSLHFLMEDEYIRQRDIVVWRWKLWNYIMGIM